MILDHKLDFQSHIREVILKARRGIGLIKYLSKYVFREVLDQVYRLYIRPHLDYGDIIIDLTLKCILKSQESWSRYNIQRL